MTSWSDNLLEVGGLSVSLNAPDGRTLWPVRDVTFNLQRGEAIGIVGESGSGKSLAMLALMGLLPRRAHRHAQRLQLGDTELQGISDSDFARRIAGKRMGMIFQEPMTSLNPVYCIERQLTETATLHGHVSRRAARARALELLDLVGVPEPPQRLRQYPHQLSGGLRQRVMIAMALMNSPDLLIADEPTTALDVTIKVQILDLLARLRRELGTAMILVSHDIAAVARTVDQVAVMYAGTLVETGPVHAVLNDPHHPYTRGLLRCAPHAHAKPEGQRLGSIPGQVPQPFEQLEQCSFAPRCAFAREACRLGEPVMQVINNHRASRCVFDAAQLDDAGGQEDVAARSETRSVPVAGASRAAVDQAAPLLELKHVSRTFTLRGGLFGRQRLLPAVKDLSLALHPGEVLALVGESGSGKTTVARMLLGLQAPTSGDICYGGRLLNETDSKVRARHIQPVFQDPYSSLNPLRTVGDTIGRPLAVHGVNNAAARRKRVLKVMDQVGLARRFFEVYPGQMSGGQRQRVALARALVLEPEIIICDEPTSALDVSVQAQILNLLLDLRQRLGLTYFIITHDLAVVRFMATRVAVMCNGQLVEQGETERVYTHPAHDYTRQLLDSAADPLPQAV